MILLKDTQINWKSSDEEINNIQKQIDLGNTKGDFKPRKHLVKAYELALEALKCMVK